MFKYLLAALIVVSAFGLSDIVSTNDDDRVKINFYFESLCPYCNTYIGASLSTAANTKDFWKICDFNMFPYGNARKVQNGSSWAYTCQHGASECEGNLVETCAIKKFDFYQYGLPFIICLEKNTGNWKAQGKKCADQLKMSWDVINSCAYGPEGNKLQYEMALATQSLNPAHTYVPWFTVNGKHDSNAQSAIRSNMVRYVCSAYKGPIKIDACS